MATKLKRQADIIKNSITNYENALNDYSYAIDNSSPVMITYYKISSEASRQDYELENVTQLIGAKSALKYIKIKNFPVYNLTIPEIQRNRTDRGFEIVVDGDFIMSPVNNISPVADEFFVIEQDGFEEHIFKITDVQYDRMTSQKYYRCSYSLYNENAAVIEENVIKTMIFSRDDDGSSEIVEESEAARKESIEIMVDTLIDEYINLFYSTDNDEFEYYDKKNNIHYWTPYVNHFLYKNAVLEKYNQGFLEEIYIKDFNSGTYPEFYNEESYRNTLYFAIDVDDCNILKYNSTFAQLSNVDIMSPYTLPFYTSGEKYTMIDFYNSELAESFYLTAFNYILEDETKILSLLNAKYKYEDLSEYEDVEKSSGLESHRCLYKFSKNNKIVPDDILYIADSDGTVVNATIDSLINTSVLDTNENHYLFKLIKDYFNKTFVPTDDMLKSLNIYHYKATLKNYLLMPIIIHILKQQI